MPGFSDNTPAHSVHSMHQTHATHPAHPATAPVHGSTPSRKPIGGGVKKIRDPRALDQAEVDRRLKALHRRARWLDSRFSCCCGLLRFGVESIIGLVPVIGDFAGVFLAVTYMNTIRRRFNVPPSIVSQMTVNIAIDFCVGLVPILGDLIDTLFKANMRNYVLVEKFVHDQRRAAGRDLEAGGNGEGIQEPRPGYFPSLPLRLNAQTAAKAVASGAKAAAR